MQFLNVETGEILEVDPAEGRLRRMRRRLRHWEGLLKLPSGCVDFIGICLTYKDGSIVHPRDISKFMNSVRMRLGDGLLAYAWVAEVQRRGVLHYHILLVVRRGVRIPKPDQWVWQKGSSSVQLVFKHVGYLTKYAQKEEQKDLSKWKGFRAFAVCIRAFLGDLKYRLRFSTLPRWVLDRVEASGLLPVLPVRVKGGGWRFWGEVWRSPWVMLKNSGALDFSGVS